MGWTQTQVNPNENVFGSGGNCPACPVAPFPRAPRDGPGAAFPVAPTKRGTNPQSEQERRNTEGVLREGAEPGAGQHRPSSFSLELTFLGGGRGSSRQPRVHEKATSPELRPSVVTSPGFPGPLGRLRCSQPSAAPGLTSCRETPSPGNIFSSLQAGFTGRAGRGEQQPLSTSISPPLRREETSESRGPAARLPDASKAASGAGRAAEGGLGTTGQQRGWSRQHRASARFLKTHRGCFSQQNNRGKKEK